MPTSEPIVHELKSDLCLDLESLREYEYAGPSLAVVGYPIRHSLSPVFQNAALRAIAQHEPQFNDWVYHRIEAPVEQLGEVIALCQTKGFRGLNLTLPHKVEALKWVDRVDGLAGKMGAVNTVVFESGESHAFNTDGFGLSKAVKEQLKLSFSDRPVLVIGAGGAARAAAIQCLSEGCSCLGVCNRSPERLRELIRDLRSSFPKAVAIEGFSPEDEFPQSMDGAIAIQATSLGLKPEDGLPVPDSWVGKFSAVYDMVYGLHTTPMVRHANACGIRAADGVSMLVYQGARAFSLWTGREAPISAMMDALLRKVEA
jgi:shikimate dehydrogenase